jgi:hypothetical protein
VAAAAGILASKLAAGGTANRVVGTTDGTTMTLLQIVAAMLAPGAANTALLTNAGATAVAAALIANANIDPAAAIAASKLAAGGTANRVVATADGTTMAMQQIATAMLAANAVSQIGVATGSTSGPTSAATSLADVTDMTVTLTTSAGGVQIAIFSTAFFHSNGTATCQIAIGRDGVSDVGLLDFTVSNAAHIRTANAVAVFTGLSAGSHTWKGRAKNDVGATMTFNGTQRTLAVIELKA